MLCFSVVSKCNTVQLTSSCGEQQMVTVPVTHGMPVQMLMHIKPWLQADIDMAAACQAHRLCSICCSYVP